MRHTRIALMVLAVLIMCISQAYASTLKGRKGLKGKIKDNRYCHSLFQVSIPDDILSGTTVIDGIDNGVYWVIFLSDDGAFTRFDVSLFPDDTLLTRAIAMAKDNPEEIFGGIVQNCMIEHLKPRFPAVKILSKKVVELEDGNNGYFVLIDLPGGAEVINVATRQRADDIRGALAYFCGNQFVLISASNGLFTNQWDKRMEASSGSSSFREEYLLKQLLKAASGFRNNQQGVSSKDIPALSDRNNPLKAKAKGRAGKPASKERPPMQTLPLRR